MCLGIPGKIIEIEGRNAVADILGAKRKITIELLENVKAGDYVLIHAGCAIELFDEAEALETIRLFNEFEILEK